MSKKNYIPIIENIVNLDILDYTSKNILKGFQVKKIVDKTHPCYNQCGLFSTTKWYSYDIVGEYKGEILSIYDVNRSIPSDYFAGFSIDGFQGIGIDAQKYGSEMRFINHYKGISQKPNVKFVDYIDDASTRIMVVCTREINVGEELVVDYGYEP
jgi:SET domain-containing protein